MNTKEKIESTPKLVVRKTVKGTREQVFDAWTKPEIMQKWLFPGAWSAKSSNELKVGGSYTHEMIGDGGGSECETEAANKPEGRIVHTGKYLEIHRPEKLVFTWNSPFVQNTKVTVELRDLTGSTEVVLTHELLETEDLRKRHSDGWNGCLSNLAGYFQK